MLNCPENHFKKYHNKEIIMESDSKNFVEDSDQKLIIDIPISYLVTNYNQTLKGKVLNKILSSSRLDLRKNKQKQSFSSKDQALIIKNSPSLDKRYSNTSFPISCKNKVHSLTVFENMETCTAIERVTKNFVSKQPKSKSLMLLL